ncbi:MAG: hypothetical protein ABIG89_05380 [Candidatus Woesearchaeota archaeon]
MALLIIAGCGGEKECRENSDCSAGSCFDVKCEDNKCIKTAQPDCCGNLMCESEAGENSCNCKSDCKKPKCEGKFVVKERGSKKYYGEYLEYMCKDDKCMLTFDEKSVKKIPLLSEKTINNVNLELGVTFNKPFDMTNDKVMIALTLKDYDQNKAKMPFTVKSIKIMDGDLLYGQTNTNKELVQIGAGIKESVPLTLDPESKEEEKSLTLKVDYEMTKINSKGEEELIRDSFVEKFSQKIFLIVTGEADLE